MSSQNDSLLEDRRYGLAARQFGQEEGRMSITQNL